jgi:hypothetical protein
MTVLTTAGVVMGVTLAVAPTAPRASVVPGEAPARSQPTPAVGETVGSPSPPVALEIPSIISTGAIAELGTTRGGVMEIPGEALSLGWFAAGPAPGEARTAVITGYAE